MHNKIIFFRALVLSTLLSGLEVQRLERMQIHCLRVLLHGAARAKSNEWVRQRTRAPTIASTMRVRRVKWLRQIYEHQEMNRLLI
eukprot:13342185-Heterocapsa_arctica.AAC.1